MYFGILGSAGVAVAAIGSSAIFCAKRRAYIMYLAFVAFLTAVAIAVDVMTARFYSPRGANVLGAFMYLILAAVYLIAPGLLVRKSPSPAKILVVTLLVTALAFPAILFSYIDLVCFLGFSCI